MLRILSILFVLGGLIVAGIGGAALLEQYAPKEPAVVYDSAAVETTSAIEELPAAEPATEMTPPDAIAKTPGFESTPEARRAGPENADPDVAIASEPALSEEEQSFNFQTQTEDAPMAMSAPGEEAEVSTPDAVPAPQPSFEDTLKTVPVAHETPRSAEYKRAFNVTFAIDATGDTTAVDALPGRGVIEESEAMVSERVEVRLSGASFNIAQTSPPVQILSPMTENTWRWSVTPLTAGDHDLTFEIFAIDSDSVTPLRTYRDTVTVKVSGLNRAIAFADQANPLFVLLGGLGSAIAGLVGAMRFFGKR